ncbi:Iron/zinc purple acid phosphatase [Phytophthora megakarya]|uniref:Purple acid phosphatase n=1 Tax=Phytophthora megakarya TaxID=4795 RepID=A0A225UZC4_9STRA|nr:Iron/zinc purple acid phosphatase [Phytophthora megakarya]
MVSKVITVGLVFLACCVAEATLDINGNTACTWDSEHCLPSALCTPSGNTNKPCRVKNDSAFIPQQLHLAYAGIPAGTGITLSWSTYTQLEDSSAWIGSSKDTLTLMNTPVTQTSYYNDATYNMFHYHATITGLKPHTKYFYKVGSKSSPNYTSDVYSFVTARTASDNSTFNMIVYGDFGPGDQSKNTLTYVNSLTLDNVDFIYHLGDIGYADDDYLMPGQALGFFYEKTYNKWMNSLMPVMSSVPYMVLVGNHEAECHSPSCQVSSTKSKKLGNYTAYNTRFRMPSAEVGGKLNMWYSFEHGPIHFTTISTETDYPGAPDNKYTIFSRNGNFGDQLTWVESDLKKAAENRANVPWIIVGMHRPIYDLSSTKQFSFWSFFDKKSAKQNARLQAAFEALFLKYKVDVVLTAHEHCYQRHTPIRNNEPILDGISSNRKTYNNPQAPVYILSGAGGGIEGHETNPHAIAEWNVVSNYVDFGITALQANRTMLSWKFVSSSTHEILDEFVVLKTGDATNN